VKAARLHAKGDIRLHAEPEPLPGKDEELLQVTAVGLCGSDLHWYEDGGIGDAGLSRPLVLGHEIGGVIVSGPRAGTRVAVDPADPCGHCDLCMAGSAHLCAALRFCGHSTTDGGLRERMTWPSRLLHPIPASISDTDAPLLEPLGVVLHAVDLGRVTPGMSAGVYGAGPIGLLLIRLLAAIGVGPIVATDLLEHRLAAAMEMGASRALRAEPAMPGGGGTAREWPEVDVAFETAGADDAVDTAIASVRAGGRVVLVGIPPTDRTSFNASMARRKELSLLLSRRMTGVDLPRAIRLVASGVADLSGIVNSSYPLARSSEAFASLVSRQGLKIVVEPSA
jgi:L-iditol 2-dehydrogenase